MKILTFGEIMLRLSPVGKRRFAQVLPGEYDIRIVMDENEDLEGIPDVRREAGEVALPISLVRDMSLVLPVMRTALMLT